MPTIQIGIFSVTITSAVVTQGLVERTSPASVVAGLLNVTLGLTLKDEFGNLASGSFTITVNGGSWYNALVVFIDGIATITFGVTFVGAYTDIPVAVIVP